MNITIFNISITPLHVIWFNLVLSVVLRIGFINTPPVSIHTWRQCNTLAVARNMYTESMNPMVLRVDNRFDTDGVTGGNFPAYEFLTASIYHITGEKHFVARLLSLVLHLWGAFGMYYLIYYLLPKIRIIEDEHLRRWSAALGLMLYLWSPTLFYYGITALPDNLALPCSVWGAFFILKFTDTFYNPAQKSNYLFAFLSLLFFILAGLTKIYFLSIGFFIAPWIIIKVLNTPQKSYIKLLFFVIFGILVSGIPILWYLRAVNLIKQSGLADFGIEFRPTESWNKGLSILSRNLSSDIPELLLNYAGLIFLLLGIKVIFSHRLSKQFLWSLGIWGLGLVTYHIVELRQMEHHDYYMWTHLPFFFIIASIGMFELKTRSWGKFVVIVLLLLLPIFASTRIIPSRWIHKNPEVPDELQDKNQLVVLQNAVPKQSLCIVGPDVSNCIYFYYLNKKGWCYPELSQLADTNSELKQTNIQVAINKGAKYLYWNDHDHQLDQRQDLNPYFRKKIAVVGSWVVYELKSP